MPRKPALGLGDGHALAGAHADEVAFELGDHGQDVEQQLADCVGRVIDGAAEAEFDLAGGEVIGDVAGVGQGPDQPVELGDDQGVAGSAGGEGFSQAGA